MKSGPCALVLMMLFPVVTRAQEKVDLAAIHRIKREAFQESKVMDHLFYLTDVNGPRLTGSPGFTAATEWSIRSLKSWGIAGARTEAWGTFGRGWAVTRFAAHLRQPVYAPLDGVSKAWSGGTSGPVAAPVVAAPLFTADEHKRGDDYDIPTLKARIDRYITEETGKLRGAIVLIDALPEPEEPTEPVGERYDTTNLAAIARAPDLFPRPSFEYPLPGLPADEKERERLLKTLPDEVGEDYYIRWIRTRDSLNAFLGKEGVVAVLSSDARGSGGIVFATTAGSWESGAPTPPPVIALPPEEYGRLARLAAKKIPARVDLDVEVKFYDDHPQGVNVLAEIPGGRKKDEVVMLGAHLDSWHGGTGATDNAAGCAVALEAMRILKTLDLKMDRTVRLALWGGEEQGLFGSRGYVREHFGDPVSLALRPEHGRLSGYFNVDNGTGRIRGVYLQENDMARPIFEAWLEPFRDLGATTVAIANTTDTDHVSFDAVGLPGFQFIQDPLDYETRTHHSNLDVYDHVQPSDLMQASAILASFAYNAATRPDLLPRKPLPPPLPRGKAAPGSR
ncbi:MAG TPA: M20/M25/M40 family metallo-hydrolase [Candidatus Dormibacteraeota bacterium]|nr:M20/M25/M40 family metallo-hydrolase [Candidatus Dormibacteraeota bacterium]